MLRTRLFAALMLLFALAGAMHSCSPKSNEAAVYYANHAHKALEMAYALDSVRADRACLAYECLNVDECPAADECPDNAAVKARWAPVWEAYEVLADAIEAGKTEEAQRAYCTLVNIAGQRAVKVPLPPC